MHYSRMANGFKIDLRLDSGKEVKYMDSCDSAGRSMICGGSKKILTWLNVDFILAVPDFGCLYMIFLNISFSPPRGWIPVQFAHKFSM